MLEWIKIKWGFCMETKINGEKLPYVVCKLKIGITDVRVV